MVTAYLNLHQRKSILPIECQKAPMKITMIPARARDTILTHKRSKKKKKNRVLNDYIPTTRNLYDSGIYYQPHQQVSFHSIFFNYQKNEGQRDKLDSRE